MSRFELRRNKLRRAVLKTGAEGLLVTNFNNVTYLTGFTGDDSYLLVGRNGDVLVTDSRYTIQLQDECPNLDISIRKRTVKMITAVGRLIRSAKIARLGVEGDSMVVSLRDRLKAELPKVELVATSGLVEQFRQIKDKYEIAEIRNAVRIAEKAFGVVRASLKPDMTEKRVSDELEYQIRLFGGQSAAFTTIVGVGPRAALPHATVTDRQIGSSDFVLIDWGAQSAGYKSDLTRVLVTGKISTKLHRIYGVVLKAQAAAIAAIRPGAISRDVDRAARQVIAKAGFGPRFGHGLGHGIGLDIHEGPGLSTDDKKPLKAGQVITVEPGIYLPGWGGVRIEDDVLVTRGGHEVLTTLGKKWDEVIVD